MAGDRVEIAMKANFEGVVFGRSNRDAFLEPKEKGLRSDGPGRIENGRRAKLQVG